MIDHEGKKWKIIVVDEYYYLDCHWNWNYS